MATLIAKQFSFEAAHYLPNHDGQCRNMHGHSYVAEVGIAGIPKAQGSGPEEGMVLDFGRLTYVWKRDIEPLVDHSPQGTLNEVMPLELQPPTAEHIAKWIYQQLAMYLTLPQLSQLEFVKVWETRTAYAEYSE